MTDGMDSLARAPHTLFGLASQTRAPRKSARPPVLWNGSLLAFPEALAKVCLAALSLTLTAVSAGQSPPRDSQSLPSAAQIIGKALDWAERQEEQGFEEQLSCRYVSVKEGLDENRQVKSREVRLYKVYPIGDELYYELVRIDGRPLSEDEVRKEAEKKRKFIEESRSSDDKKKKKDEERVKFNDELISRYRAEVVGREAVNGRPAYIIRFEPKSGNLPVRRRIDHALNNSRGKVWIDAEEFGVARVEFELIEPVRLWLGILGKIGDMDGRFEQVRLKPGIWFPKTMSFYLKGRALFKSFHERRTSHWRDIEIEPTQTAAN